MCGVCSLADTAKRRHPSALRCFGVPRSAVSAGRAGPQAARAHRAPLGAGAHGRGRKARPGLGGEAPEVQADRAEAGRRALRATPGAARLTQRQSAREPVGRWWRSGPAERATGGSGRGRPGRLRRFAGSRTPRTSCGEAR
eukprot:12641934-Alexandrium_andersonii.AAC.1